MNNSPIAIFVYNRPEHTAKLIDSLLTNNNISQSPITIYSDGPRNSDDIKKIEQVRTITKQKLPKATLITNNKNKGLAESIITGVTEQCQLYGKVIVLEDDLIVSPCLLDYMNSALEYYENKPSVMHISAYLPPVKTPLPSSFFFREPNSWAWATWKRAWDYFEEDSKKLALEFYKKDYICDFNQGFAEQYWEMLCKQSLGEVDSWAIRWHATVFKHNGLALYPGESLVSNIGFDNSGQHCSPSNKYEVKLSSQLPALTDELKENKAYAKAIRKFKLNSPVHSLSRRIRHYLNRKQYLTALSS